MPRQPILSVLGHTDAGKTSLLDRIRSSRIVEGEEGGITQMIGATEVPIDTVQEQCGELLDTLDIDITIPGLLFIDTPGHAAFSSLRKRGGNIADIAVVVIDVEDGVQPQTEEAIETLRESQTPFVIALNKIDKVNGWQDHGKFFSKSIQQQSERVRQQVDDRVYELMSELDDFDMMIDRFDRVDDFQRKVAVVPMSAKTGEGLPELLMVIVGLAQNYLSDRLEVEEGKGRGTVLEVSQMEGMGTTIDVIQYDGIFNKKNKLVYGTKNGAEVTEIRAMLKPKQLEEIREENEYDRIEESKPASGVRIVGKDLEGVVSGAPVRIASEEQLSEAIDEVEEELETIGFETHEHGVVVKADSLGSLEALMKELEKKDVKVQKAEVGPITKADVIDASNEKDEERAIFAFNTGYTEQGENAVNNESLKVFEGEVIYQLLEGYEGWRKKLQREKREQQLEELPRPAKIRVLHDHVFRSSNPAVVGVKIEAGVLNPGSTLMNADGETVGRVKSVQDQNESLDKADKGDEVAVSIANATLDRDFEEGGMLYTKLSGDEYRKLNELEDLTSKHEKDVTEEIVDIQDKVDPRWKLS